MSNTEPDLGGREWKVLSSSKATSVLGFENIFEDKLDPKPKTLKEEVL